MLIVVESSDTEVELGTGLGLAIVARIVRNMNGQLRAESEEGRGSKFTFAFSFPIPTSAQTKAFLETASVTPPPEQSQMTYTAPLSPERHTQTRRHSNDSVQSRGSANSGRSEIDQLVDMIGSQNLEDAPRSSGNLATKRRSSPTLGKGEFNVQDSGTPIRSVKVDEDDVDVPAASLNRSALSPASNLSPQRNTLKPALPVKPKHLRVLVVEDDPVNRAILKKRLEMDGHDVILTQNGSEVVEIYGQCWQGCDIILMDLQVTLLTAFANQPRCQF